MSFSERIRPPHDGIKPSDALNQAFTPLMEAFRDKIDQTDWLERADVRGMRTHGIRATAVPDQGFGGVYRAFPKIFDFHDASIKISHDFLRPPMIDFHAPVGEYGGAWAERLVNAGAKLAEAVYLPGSDVNMRDEALEMNDYSGDFLDKYTYRGRVSPDRDLGSGPIRALAESFQSTCLSAGYLTMYGVPGYEEEPEKLLADLASQGTLSRLSLIIPPTVTVQLIARGGVFAKPVVETDPEGKLRLRPDIIKHFIEEKKIGGVYDNFTTGAPDFLDRPGCPVGRKLPGASESGVDIAAELFARTVAVQRE